MKKALLYLCLLLPLLLLSCERYKTYELDGLWQLKTVEDAGGNMTLVDTIFYGIQRECIFSFIVLENENQANVFYGYTDRLSDKELHISMDEKSIMWWDFPALSGWNSTDNLFKIEKITGKNMVLSSEGKIYSFKKQ